jgi:hypothetical protein
MGGAFGQSWVGSRAISEVFPLARAHQIYKVRWTTKEHIPRVAPRNELHRGRDRPVGELRGQTATAIAPGGKTSAKGDGARPACVIERIRILTTLCFSDAKKLANFCPHL